METTRALSPEIIGLFGRVQSQAEEYAKAFELLEKYRKEFEASVSKLNTLQDNVRSDSELAISKINSNVLESLIILKNKTDEAIKLSIDLGDIKAFKTSFENLKNDLTNLSNTLNKQSEEFESALKYFKKKSEMELESTMLGLKAKVEKEIHSEAQKIEIRTNLKLKQMESILLSFDERLKLLESNMSSAVKKLSLDIDLIRQGYDFDSEGNDLPPPVNRDDSITKRLLSLEDEISSINSRLEDSFVPNVPPPRNVSDARIEEFDKKLFDTNRRISSMLAQQQSASGSGNAPIAVAVVALILAIVAIVMSFI